MKLLTILYLTAATIVFSQNGKLVGKIFNAVTGEPILAASIILDGTDIGAASIGKGEYFITKIPGGEYTISVSRMGYNQTLVKDIQIKEGITTHLNISLNPNMGEEIKFNTKMEEMYLNKFSKDVREELNKLKEQKPDKYYRFIMDKYLTIAAEGFLSRSEQDEINLIEAELENLSVRFHQVNKKNKAEIEKKIKTKLNELFTLKEELRIKQIFELEQKLADLKLAVGELKYRRETLIESQLDKLTKK